LQNAANFKFRVGGLFTVLDRPGSSTAERIEALVQKLLAKRGVTRAVGREDDLAESGLSSLDMVNLMLAVEAEFGVKIPDGAMTPANFRSLARIDALVGALLEDA
jgi:acyl carrier protein